MDINSRRVESSVDLTDRDAGLIDAAKEIAYAAEERSLVFSIRAGVVAVGSAQQATEWIPDEFRLMEHGKLVAGQLPAAYLGYQATSEALNMWRRKKVVDTVASEAIVTAEFADWLTGDRLAYLSAVEQADPGLQHRLVATPNVLVGSKDISKAMTLFGQGQPHPAHIDQELLRRYSPQQISGTNPKNGKHTVFSMIHNKLTPGMAANVKRQREELLVAAQARYPFLKVTSLLEDFAYLCTLRSLGYKLVGPGVFELTYSRKFNLPEQHLDDWVGVPRVSVRQSGRPGIYDSYAEIAESPRVDVG